MGTRADSHAQPELLCSYFQSERGQDVPPRVRTSLEDSLALEPLKSLIVTDELVHRLRLIVERAYRSQVGAGDAPAAAR